MSFPAQGKNGHTLVGAILDSHSRIAIANNYRCKDLARILEVASSSQWEGPRYSFCLPEQGKWKDLKAVGSTGFYFDSPIPGLTMKQILILRNPFDVIGSRYVRYRNRAQGKDPLEYTIELYEAKLQEVLDLKDMFVMYHEVWTQDPLHWLPLLLSFLELQADKTWLVNAKSLIVQKPIRSFNRAPWTEQCQKKVMTLIDRYSLLNVYKEQV